MKRETLESELAKVDPDLPRTLLKTPTQKSSERSRFSYAMGPEKELLCLLVKDEGMVERVGERLGPNDFIDSNHRAIFELLLNKVDFVEILARLDAMANLIFQEILADPREFTESVGERIFKDVVNRMLSDQMQKKMDKIDEMIRNNNDDDRLTELLIEKTKLGQERRELGLDWSAVARKTFK